MKRLITLILAAGLVLGSVAGASAIDFKASGSWDFYFNVGQTTMFKQPYDSRHNRTEDMFDPGQRIRIKLDAIASENLSGTVQIEIGSQWWGKENGGVGRSSGAALGADGVAIEIKHAYLDWIMPNTELRVRMGIQNVGLPNAAGGSAILDDDLAAVIATYKFNDHVTLLAGWARPYNDNYKRSDSATLRDKGLSYNNGYSDGVFDNVDLGVLALPLAFDGFSLTPWVAFGMAGSNAARALALHDFGSSGGYAQRGLLPLALAQGKTGGRINLNRDYASMFWAGIPIKITAFDPFNFEFDANYGYLSGWGKYDDMRSVKWDGTPRRNDTKREGFVIKALAEYKLDWGVPGIFGWYGSGDTNAKDGSGRMPYLSPVGTFSTFGLGNYYGDVGRTMIGERIDTGYSGTWAIGAQIRDMSFLQDLSHTLRVIYWRGTNDPGMAKSIRSAFTPEDRDNVGWNGQPWGTVYLTQNDYLVEVNLDSVYKIYENLDACLELGYIVNGVDKNTWKWSGNQKADAWKAALTFRYSF